jgi:hypothetical protein
MFVLTFPKLNVGIYVLHNNNNRKHGDYIGLICMIVWWDFPVIKCAFNPYADFVCVRDLKFNPENLKGTLYFVRDTVAVFELKNMANITGDQNGRSV